MKNTLIGLSEGKNCEGGEIKLTKYLRKGSVDYNKILEDLKIDVNIEEDTKAWKITVTY